MSQGDEQLPTPRRDIMLVRSIHSLQKFDGIMDRLLEKIDKKKNLSYGPKPMKYHTAVPLEEVLVNGAEKTVIKYTKPQPGGVKIGEIAKYVHDVGQDMRLAVKIDHICKKQSSVGILFDNFDGDVIANWGESGAANAWLAYLRGFTNLYCARSDGGSTRPGTVLGDRVVFVGIVDSDDLQTKAMELEKGKHITVVNAQLSTLANERSLRLINMLKEVMKSNLTTLFLLGGGDHAVYACAASLKTDCNRALLLRIDRHMDERDTGLRCDPTENAKVYPHSGNGITQAKREKLINFDFLLGCDSERNNDQCIRNSESHKETCFTSITSIDKLRIDPKLHIDTHLQEVAKLLQGDDKLDFLVNIDCDTFNGIPSSAETYIGGLNPKWALYFLEKLSELPRPPRIIRIAELHFSGYGARRRTAIDFATEVLRSGVKSMQTFYKS